MANEIAQLEYSKATAVGVAKLNESIAKVDTKITDIIKLKKAEPKSPIRTISSPKIGFDFKDKFIFVPLIKYRLIQVPGVFIGRMLFPELVISLYQKLR